MIEKKVFKIHVKRTGCKKTEIINKRASVIEMNVRGKPEGGKANLEIVKFFTKKYKLKAKIIKGLKSKKKLIGLYQSFLGINFLN